MTQLPEHETHGQDASEVRDALPRVLPTSKAGEAGVTWADPDADPNAGRAGTEPASRQTDQTQDGNGTETSTSLLARLRRGRHVAPSGTAQERAEQVLPPEDTLRAILKAAPLDLRLHGEANAPLIEGDRARALVREPRSGGQIQEDDFRQESDLRPEDLQEVRAERTELLRAYFRARRGAAGQTVSLQDFQQNFLVESGWFGRSAWLERHLLAPWSVQQAAPPQSDQFTSGQSSPEQATLMMAPRGRARFGSFVRVSQGGGKSGREALEAQTRRPEVEEALAKARLEVVRAATTRLFADWEQETDDLPPAQHWTEQHTDPSP